MVKTTGRKKLITIHIRKEQSLSQFRLQVELIYCANNKTSEETQQKVQNKTQNEFQIEKKNRLKLIMPPSQVNDGMTRHGLMNQQNRRLLPKFTQKKNEKPT